MRSLDFSHHALNDVPPDVFAFERTLEELHLNSNRITDLPRQLFLCHELRRLYLQDNDLASIPAAIGTLSNLQAVDLSRNNLTDISDDIRHCRNLQVGVSLMLYKPNYSARKIKNYIKLFITRCSISVAIP